MKNPRRSGDLERASSIILRAAFTRLAGTFELAGFDQRGNNPAAAFRPGRIADMCCKVFHIALAAPALRCRPRRVVGIPVARANLAFADETPNARFHEKDVPNFFPMIAAPLLFIDYLVFPLRPPFPRGNRLFI